MASYIKTTIFNDFTPFFSPVKFHDSSQEAAEDCSLPDLSGILASLNNTSVDCNALEREIGLSEENGAQNLATSVQPLSGELSLHGGCQEQTTYDQNENEEQAAQLAMEATAQLWAVDDQEGGEVAFKGVEQYALPVSSSISNILNDLSSGESDVSQSSQSEEEESRMTLPSLVKADNDAARLYPIFYKESAKSSGEPGTHQQQQPGKRFLCSSLPQDQAYIDAGQKELGATLCPTCGSAYSKGDPQDEAMHNIQHTGLLERLKHQGWSKERVVATYPEGSRVISIRCGTWFLLYSFLMIYLELMKSSNLLKYALYLISPEAWRRCKMVEKGRRRLGNC